MELFRLERLADPDWQEPEPYPGFHASFNLRPAHLAADPVKWRNVEGNLRVRITLPELRPTPTWESEEECDDEIVLVLRDTDLERVTVSYTVTADTYGEAFEQSFTVPVERISAVDAVRSVLEFLEEND
ncbi:hypothetical protein FHT40_006306 [Mycolicibacterium sp. BK556]|uniref:hypothetical protein n=1 Tax=unclassified Mycolicibacterium TaxID=2636767 RepID=UPI00161ED2AC|nr:MULTISPECIES: hypothetical protein [unclassified Mycolicibacterium]MBB3606615.1 hypothetical protein [Mycolicibacterium sp. BK556]MBB3636138.1 hypothetical protein [Mycolicibacterium sp. BK607]